MHSETFGEMIRRLREEKGLSLRKLAAMVDFDQSSISKVERNGLIVPSRLVRQLANSLEVPYREMQIKYLSEKIYHELSGKDYALEAIDVARRKLEIEGRGTSVEFNREVLIQKIREFLRGKPVEKAWVFGSFAREQESYESDLDLLVRFKQPNTLNLFDYVGLKQDLEELTGRNIDLVEEGFLVPNARESVEKEKILIYER